MSTPDGPSPRDDRGSGLTRCDMCPHACALKEGQLGFCRARRCTDGTVVSESYGRITSLALDPIEKKPIARWRPRTLALSVGSYGCNLRCPFCQNWQIAQTGSDGVAWEEMSPERLVALARDAHARDPRVQSIAYTYNEPLVGWEYVRDCSRLAREAGFGNVLVSNGCASQRVIRELAPLVDAANIDYKGDSDRFYRMCVGSRAAVRASIELLAATPTCHLEVTTLVVPGENDTPEEMRSIARWLGELESRYATDITLHVTRFFPRWHMSDRTPTPVATVYRLADVARERLDHVFVGNC